MNRTLELIYDNPLSTADDIQHFVMEGQGVMSFPLGRLRMESALSPEQGQAANIVLWCRESFPADIETTWDFWPVREPGLCILFFAALGTGGESIFEPALHSRSGLYRQYHHGDVNMLHLSYFRRKEPGERAFHTCNLRKSYGFHLVAQGPDPLPSVSDAAVPYHMRLRKFGNAVTFWINDLQILHWEDDGQSYGPTLGAGAIGFRQVAPLIAEYQNLKVYRIVNCDGCGD